MNAGELLTAMVRGKANCSVIEPCPYVSFFNGQMIDYVWQFYDSYADFVEFDDGKPSKCTRYFYTDYVT